MTDDFSDGWIEFESFIDQLLSDKKLTLADIKEYVCTRRVINETS
jgi:hypothetical protein